MKNIATGTGIALLAGAIVAYPIIDRVMPRAEAGATHVAAVVAAATAQNPPEPTIVWFGVTAAHVGSGQQNVIHHRLWSDGRTELRFAAYNSGCSLTPTGCSWVEVPPPNSGNGFACRADLDGNRIIDGADLGLVLSNWGPQTPCAPEATYPCLTLNQPLLK